MSDDNYKTFRDDSQSEGGGTDPLGILGWVIGGKYKIRAYIGGGGFGEVYDGFNANLPEQRLVIKFFKRVQSRDKFAKEAKILCLLDHPNILRVIDYLPEEGALVVPFIDGKDGGNMLRASGPLREDLYLKVARTMSDALAYAHERRIAHRDLKPGNILIDKNEHIYLIDFGIAKEMGGSATKTAYVALTPLFAAPERQSGDQDYNPFLSDIYELGVTLFNFASNEMPYRNPSNPNPDEWGGPAIKRLSPQLRRILKKATHPDPTHRYQTAAEMAEEFRGLGQVYGTKARPKFWGIAAAIVVVAVGAFLVQQFLSQPSQETDEPPQLTVERQAEPPKTNPPPVTKPDTTTRIVVKPEEKKTEVVPSTPAVQLPTLLVHVSPQYNVSLFIDGREKSFDRKLELAAGRHEIKIVHADYPVVIDTIDLTVDRNVEYGLANRFAGIDKINFRIGIVPDDLGNSLLQVSFNGKKSQYKNEELPVLDYRRLIGPWQMRFDLVTAGGAAAGRVDSVVSFPYGGGPRLRIRGGSSTVNFGAAEWNGLESIDLLLFWSNR